MTQYFDSILVSECPSCGVVHIVESNAMMSRHYLPGQTLMKSERREVHEAEDAYRHALCRGESGEQEYKAVQRWNELRARLTKICPGSGKPAAGEVWDNADSEAYARHFARKDKRV